MKKILFFLFLMVHLFTISQTTINPNIETCNIEFIIADGTNKNLISGQFEISTKASSYSVLVEKGLLKMNNLFYCDTIYIHPIDMAYQDTLIMGVKGIDTLFLKKYSYTFTEINITARKEKSKKYQLGRKNNKCQLFFAFQDMKAIDEANKNPHNTKLVSYIGNNIGKKLKINEMYVYIGNIPKDSIPNLYINFYKNDNGNVGRPLATYLMFEPIKRFIFWKRTTGWAKINFHKAMKIPKNGFFLVLEKRNLLNYSPKIGIIPTNKKDYCNTYWYVNWERDGHQLEDKVVKTFIKAER